MTEIRELVLYHAACMDGATAAWIAKTAMPGAELVPCHYGNPPPDVTGRRVWCVDLSFPRAVLLAMKASAESLVVLDHHKTAAADLAGLDFCTFDMARSGAGLTWAHFNGCLPAPWIVSYVEDRDLWRWTLPSSRSINAAIQARPHTVESIAELVAQGIGPVAAEGAALLRYQEALVDAICRNAREVTIDGHCVLAANSPVMQSEVGERLALDRAFGVVWSLLNDGRVAVSLRSRKPAGIDVSEVAKRNGGGGHFAAAGFVVPAEEWFARMGRR